jgi:hypothetical protein
VSLAATRELADALGVDQLELLRANRHRPWTVEDGVLAFESVGHRDVFRLPDGREAQVFLLGGSSTGLADFQTALQNSPEFASAWSDVQSQIQAEGGSDLDLLAAKNALGDAFSGLTSVGGIMEGDAAGALSAAKGLVLAGNTVAGAVNHVQSLIAAAQGADPTQAFQLFTGTLIGIAVSSGALTAGIGAVIVAGVGAALSFMESAGLFGSAPQGTQICPGLYQNPAPTIQVGCVGTNAQRVKSGSPYWRHFPKESGGNTNDGQWYDGTSAISWSGSVNGPKNDWGSYPNTRMIDNAFPDYHFLACQGSIAGLSTFSQMYTQAWIANKEYELNGLKSQPDWAVLSNVVRVWNRAHDGSTYVDVAPVTKPYVAQPAMKAGGGWTGCPGNLPPYFQTCISELIANADTSTPVVSGGAAIRINTGAQKTPPKVIPFHLGPPPATSSSSSSGLSTGTKVAIGAGVVGAAGVGLWAAVGQPMTIAAAKAAVGRLVGRVF